MILHCVWFVFLLRFFAVLWWQNLSRTTTCVHYQRSHQEGPGLRIICIDKVRYFIYKTNNQNTFNITPQKAIAMIKVIGIHTYFFFMPNCLNIVFKKHHGANNHSYNHPTRQTAIVVELGVIEVKYKVFWALIWPPPHFWLDYMILLLPHPLFDCQPTWKYFRTV